MMIYSFRFWFQQALLKMTQSDSYLAKMTHLIPGLATQVSSACYGTGEKEGGRGVIYLGLKLILGFTYNHVSSSQKTIILFGSICQKKFICKHLKYY